MRMKNYRSALACSFPKRRFIAAVSGVVALVLIYFAIPIEAAEYAVRHYGYYFPLLALAGLLAYSLQFLRGKMGCIVAQLKQMGGLYFCFIGLCLILLFAHAQLGPKVLMDDAILEATAKQLHETREVYTPTFGRWVGNSFKVVDGYVDKRPILYPFVVSLAHDFTGYRPLNPYLVNLLAGTFFLALIAILGGLLAGRRGAWLMPLLWVSLPLYSQNATGSGMDLLNLLLLVVVLILSGLYWRRPSRTTEGALALAAVLLAHGRYESILFVLPAALVIVAGWFYRGEILLSAGTILAAPLLLGVLLQNKFFSKSKDLWELHSGTTEAFGLANFPENMVAAWRFFFNFGDEYANSLLLALLGVPALVLFAFYLSRYGLSLWKSRSMRLVAGLFGIFLLLHLFIILCYHDGRLDRLFASRFALPAYLLLTISIVVSLDLLTRRPRIWRMTGLAAFLFILAFTLPMNAKAVFTHRNFVAKEQAWLQAVSERHFQERCLVVDLYTVPWTTRETSAISPRQAYANAVRLSREMAADKYSAIYLVDRRSFTSNQAAVELKPSLLPTGVFDLQTIASQSFKPFQLTNVYQVEAIHVEAAQALLK